MDGLSDKQETFENVLEALETAEDFLRYFQVPFDAGLVRVKRVALLRLFQHLLQRRTAPDYTGYQQALQAAYRQIVCGRALAFASHDCGRCQGCEPDGPEREV